MSIFQKIGESLRNKKYIHPHLDGNNTDYRKYIILTYQRSGSNFLVDLLKSHPHIVSFSGILGKGKLGFGYTGYPQTNFTSTIKYRDNHPLHFLDKRVFRRYSPEIKAVGFKVDYDCQFPELLNYIRNHPEIRIIHLIRKNFLDIYISEMIVKKTKKWHAVSSTFADIVEATKTSSRIRLVEDQNVPILEEDFKIRISCEDCIKEFKKIEEYSMKYKDFFHNNEVLSVWYQNLTHDIKHETSRILSFLGVENKNLNSRFIKINHKTHKEIISNYDEVKEKLIGTKWESFVF
ncbi:MAG: sulfotransferase domain-containing protein [Bacteroidia bacterium]|nr:sulfotransferase domain-containing protein [Bacteroidia bacterium]